MYLKIVYWMNFTPTITYWGIVINMKWIGTDVLMAVGLCVIIYAKNCMTAEQEDIGDPPSILRLPRDS